ncbi:11515_t:CDS:2, partial [Funneliformis geosporum]
KATRTRQGKSDREQEKLSSVSSSSDSIIDDTLRSIFDSPMDIDDWIYVDDKSLTNSEVNEFSNSSEIDEFSNSSRIDEIFNNSKIDEFSSSSDSLITVNHAGSNQLSDEMAYALRLFEVTSRCNLIDDAFRQTMLAVNNGNISQFRIKKKLKSIENLEPIWIDMCINSCCAYTGRYKEHIQCEYCGIPRYQNAISNVDLIS